MSDPISPESSERSNLPPDAATTEADHSTIHLGDDSPLDLMAFAPDSLQDAVPNPAANPYELQELIGKGGMGEVYSAADHNIGRRVAMKVLPATKQSSEMVARFVEEARITGQLEHPNVVAVHHLGREADNRYYYTMKLINGSSLKAVIAQMRNGEGEYTLAAMLAVFQKCCDAVAYAHAKGIIHRDLKPDNIMIGEFGAVQVMDWGLAKQKGKAEQTEDADDDQDQSPGHTRFGQVLGTPAFMAPEQAAGLNDQVDERSDIYSLGAILYNILVLRPVIQDPADEARIISPSALNSASVPRTLPADLRSIPEPQHCPGAQVPKALSAIAMKALAREPDARYQSVRELQRDVEAFQNSFPTSAEQTDWVTRLRLLIRRRRKDFTIAALALVALALFAAGSGFVWFEQAKSTAHWGEPVLVETFDDDSWRERWTVVDGEHERQDGRLISMNRRDTDHEIVLNQRLSGSVALEFEGEMLADSLPGDLSIFWALDDEFRERYYFQTAAYNNTFARILDRTRHLGNRFAENQLAYHPMKMVAGHRYHIRAEVDWNRLLLFVDGVKVCEYQHLFPFTSGRFGLYTLYSGKAIDNIRLYRKGVAEEVSVVTVGDRLYQQNQFALARVEYEHIAANTVNDTLAMEARYKLGLCSAILGESKRAFVEWSKVRGSEFEPLVDLHRLPARFDAGEHQHVLGEIQRLHDRGNNELRRRVAGSWKSFLTRLSSHQDVAVQDYLALGERLYKHDTAQHWNIARVLRELGHAETVLARYPYQRTQCAKALLDLWRPEEVLEHYPEQRRQCAQAVLALGRPELVLKQYQEQLMLGALAKIRLGRASELLDDPDLPEDMRIRALQALGREQQILSEFSGQTAAGLAQISMGRTEEAMAQFPDDETVLKEAMKALGKHRELRQKYPHDRFLNAEITARYGDAEDALRRFLVVHHVYADALLRLGRAEEVAQRFPQGSLRRIQADYVIHLKRLANGESDAADNLLRQIQNRASGHNWSALAFAHDVLPAFLEPVDDGDSRSAIVRQYAHRHRGDVGRSLALLSYASGQTSDAEFLAQSYRLHVTGALVLAQAMRADIQQNNRAVRSYRHYAELPQSERLWDPVLDAFVAWRMAAAAR